MKDSALKTILLAFCDALCINLAYLFALLLRFDFSASGAQFGSYLGSWLSGVWVITLLKLAVFALFGLYTTVWRYAGIRELSRVGMACILGNLAATLYLGLAHRALPRSVYTVVLLTDLVLIGAVRFCCKQLGTARAATSRETVRQSFVDRLLHRPPEGTKKILIVGAGNAGAMLIDSLRLRREQDMRVMAAVDDDPAKQGKWVAGVKVVGSREDIPKLVRKYAIDEIAISLPTASKAQLREIYEICQATKCRVKVMPSFLDLLDEDITVRSTDEIDVESLLGREPAKIDLKGVGHYLEERIVLVTGAGGSIGSELCRQLAAFKPRRLVMLDICEDSVFVLQGELAHSFPTLQTDVVIASVRDAASMDEVFGKYKPHVVFHAAAHKHVPLMETNPKEAIVNNVIGTANVMDMAERYVANHFVLVSTSKAVDPSSVMGATKRICEMMMQEKSRGSRCCFSAVRFGNVLGSSGSVIPTFRRQIAAGGPVTVTHPDSERYFMTIPEAAGLVLQAGALARGGEIFTLDMGEPVRILDLAENMIRLCGLEPYVDIEIRIIGLRPGEKLKEELAVAEEGISKTSHDKIFVCHPLAVSEGLRGLLTSGGGAASCEGIIRTMTDSEVKAYIRTLVPNYTQTRN